MRFFDVLGNIFRAIGDLVKRLLPNPKDTEESRNFKTTLFFLIGCIVFMLVVALVAFIAFIQPVDETVIPDLKGTDFHDALVILQNKKLVTRVNFEFTASPQDKDLIIKQEPSPRIVRIGSPVTLWVSRGVTYDRVGNYVGKTLDEVEKLFRTSFNKNRDVIAVKKPVNYLSDKAQAGTILSQNPPAGTPLEDRTLYIEFTVSKGMVQTELVVGDYLGKTFQTAVQELQANGLPFVFNVAKPTGNEEQGLVVGQNLPAGSKIDGGTILVLDLYAPETVPENKVFGVFRTTLPEFGAPVLVKIEAELLGRRTILLNQERMGGPVALPYLLDKDADIILTLAGEEKGHEKVKPY